ncbi:MAG: PAS-domain containing protein [Roseobacter sp.]|jgi:PAS domain-containing protein|nr:PAS-domain containing protein [Roseobacter sp.]
MEILELTAIVAAAGGSTALALFWLARSQNQPTGAVGAFAERSERDGGIYMLFDGDELQHASETAAKLYQLTPGEDDWKHARQQLCGRFPGLPEHLEQAKECNIDMPARDIKDAALLAVSRNGTFTRIAMQEDAAYSPAQSQRVKAIQRELEDLRRASDTTPHAIWQVDSHGLVTWYNASYEKLYRHLHNAEPDKNRPVFDTTATVDEGLERQRVSTMTKLDGQKDWYDISAVSVGDITIYHAVDVNAVVKSEIAQRNFVQTLAKTFAQLSIGLAIFDRNGQLALFNPALIDLTELPAEFLSGRPTLLSFFDRMRENRRMPEPKNYNSWRQQIAEVIAAATDGRYQETWTLETGQTYRVKGRPHPDGAIAFLIEDISAEMSLTRNFRAELELGQSLMDTFDEALAVFSSSGVLTFCNVAYRDLWGLDPDNSFADVTINDSVQAWQRLCVPGAKWVTLTDFVLDFGETSSWEMPVELLSGEKIKCAISRIASGATIIRFERAAVGTLGKTKQLPGAQET